jgi:hypothetical protein
VALRANGAVALAVWGAGLGVALGGVAGWSVSGQFSIATAAGVLTLVLAAQLVLATRVQGCWHWGLLPLYVAGGWAASRWGWHGTLPLVVLVFCAAMAPWVWLRCIGKVPPRAVALLSAGAYGLLAVGVVTGTLPLWCLVALLALPLGLRAAGGSAGVPPTGLESRLRAFSVVFVGQVIIGLLIDGLVR